MTFHSGGAPRRILAVGLATLVGCAYAQTQAPSPAEQRAAKLVSQMTLEEKAAQIQHRAPAIPRLGIPAYNWWNEGLHGVARAGEATVFPQAIGMAASWNTQLIRDIADTTATEFRAKYLARRRPDGSIAGGPGLTVWSPNVNIFRDPRWGRGQETYGEDPFLTARMGVAFIGGLQGDDPEHPKTVATVKHFAVHSGPEPARHREDVRPSLHDVIDTYLPAFHAAVTQAKSQAVMCAYNALDGVPACANPHYLKDILRKDWKFDGHVVSDCAAIADIHLTKSHAYVRTPEEAAANAIKAGTDLFCSSGAKDTADPATTVRAVKQGLISESELDEAVRRLMVARVRLGLLDAPGEGPYAGITAKDFDTPEHRKLSTQAARESMVLLKNTGLLPFKSAPGRIAVIGPNANSVDPLVGNYNGTPSQPITVYAGIKARFATSQVSYVEGTGWVAPPLEDIPDTTLCQDAACNEPGLKAEEFKGIKLAGKPVAVRSEPNARVAWGTPTREERETSIRWTGYIRPSESGIYRFRYSGENGYRIYVDGKLVADVWDIAWPTSDTDIELTANQAYTIRVEAMQNGTRGDHRLQWSRPSASDDVALKAAKQADVVVFVGGLTARFEGEAMSVKAPGFAGGDRGTMDLPAPQQKLLERLHATGKPVVLVLMNGSAMSVNWAEANLPAIVEAWYPGGEGGQAVAELLAGDFSPAGRLPVTFYKSVDQLPPFGDYSMKGRTYRYFSGEPLYPFGYGLSYTSFAYGRPAVSKNAVKAGDAVDVSVDVRNSGSRDGDEVVQLYVSRKAGGAPIRSLRGFQRIHLKAGETRKVSFKVDAQDMSIIDAKGTRVVPSGAVDLWIGGGQPAGTKPAAGAAVRVNIKGQAVLKPF
ncbi:glycoside hydrolase family 3 C-terminal domain-containing protein [Massilia horti]|uniref:Glycoside hydrolase family 3 protein n=1 Tax=Massilia horti TaxID=2562153 RepID=A0A4Y9T4C0_9BURK|nr:glycoside hydrolase family 3 C-terminal domain-containing protein [Massilia horti]TFW32651.1 glycoside hydrolase family 3 protein [Massilia horti]